MNQSDRAIEKTALERGGSVQKRRRFKVPKVAKPKLPNAREGEDKFKGRSVGSLKPGRYICIRENVVLDWPELKPLTPAECGKGEENNGISQD